MREFRDESRDFQARTDGSIARLGTDIEDVKTGISDVKDKLENLTRAVAGEIVQTR